MSDQVEYHVTHDNMNGGPAAKSPPVPTPEPKKGGQMEGFFGFFFGLIMTVALVFIIGALVGIGVEGYEWLRSL